MKGPKRKSVYMLRVFRKTSKLVLNLEETQSMKERHEINDVGYIVDVQNGDIF